MTDQVDSSVVVHAAEETVAFWDERHSVRGPLQSGGNLGYTHEANEVLYSLRLGRLIDIVGCQTSTTTPLRVLDAGCGKGWFSRSMARFGHFVDGIDTSPSAIALCRKEAYGGERYEVSSLDAWSPGYLYDTVFSVDVLFHIMDDAQWERSLRRLASLVRLGGRLAVSDHDGDEDRVWGAYQKTRASSRYRQVVEPHGFRSDGFVPYLFRDGLTGFHTFTRTS